MTRNELIESPCTSPFTPLEEDPAKLRSRIFRLCRSIRYAQEGDNALTFDRLFAFQPLHILSEIQQTDTNALEQKFLQCKSLSENLRKERQIALTVSLFKLIADWEKRAAAYAALDLSKDLCGLCRGSLKANLSALMTLDPPEDVSKELSCLLAEAETPPDQKAAVLNEKRRIRYVFYNLIEQIRKLKGNYSAYLHQVEDCQTNDPGIATLHTFAHNYAETVHRFNHKWQSLPDLYIKNILHIHPREATTSRIVAIAQDMKPGEKHLLEKGTGFLMKKDGEKEPVRISCTNDILLQGMKVERLVSVFFKKEKGNLLPGQNEHTETILRKNLFHREGTPQPVFGDQRDTENGIHFASAALAVESPMFVLDEGVRHLRLHLHLTDESSAFLAKLAEYHHKYAWRIFREALYVEASTADGWNRVSACSLNPVFENGNCHLDLALRMDTDFPPTRATQEQIHGFTGQYPALRLLLNREAPFFACDWAAHTRIERITIHVQAQLHTSLRIWSPTGMQDTSSPFQPMGTQPEKGAWMAVSSYETAVKPILCATLKGRWSGLPDNPGGFYGHYRNYEKNMDNHAFRITTQYLSDNQWKDDRQGEQYLFGAKGKDSDIYSNLCLHFAPRGQNTLFGDDRPTYDSLGVGMLRVVLQEPEVGFGHVLYRELFARTLTHNSHHKKQRPLPLEPVCPQIENLRLSYTAQDELCLTLSRGETPHKIYSIRPGHHHNTPQSIPSGPVTLCEEPEGQGFLWLALSNAVEADHIRIFFDFEPTVQMQHEDFPSQAAWFVLRQGNRVAIPPKNFLRDTTCGLTGSGMVEILLDVPACERDLDTDGLLWLCITLQHPCNTPDLRGVYVEPIELEGLICDDVTATHTFKEYDVETENEQDLFPGIRIVCGFATGRERETTRQVRGRIARRIQTRNRLVSTRDYEQAVLEMFPQLVCATCVMNEGTIWLVVTRGSRDLRPLLCDAGELRQIESKIQPLCSPFVRIKAVNPITEELTVRALVHLKAGCSHAEVLQRLTQNINHVICPWNTASAPEPGQKISLGELRNTLQQDPAVEQIQDFSILHVVPPLHKDGGFRLLEYFSKEELIGAVSPKGVLVAGKFHQIDIFDSGNTFWQKHAGVTQLQIADTFIIRSNHA